MMKKKRKRGNKMKIRTDLALECREMFAEEISGVESTSQDDDGITVTHVNIKTDEGANRIGKPVGSYVTIEIDNMFYDDDDMKERGEKAVSDELKKLLEKQNTDSVLVVGLGNQYITPDSIGPKTVGKVTVTRHITSAAQLGFNFNIRPVSAVAPGVLGITGIETGEIVKGVVEHVKPTLVIAVDALAARKISRLGTTIQLSDTGISPGSGVGNNRKELTEKTLGVPVVAIGVPMVVDATTLAMDIVRDRAQIKNELLDDSRGMILTPNDVDAISNIASDIISGGINTALHS